MSTSTTATASAQMGNNTAKPKNLKQFMTQSTIYERNEARLAKSFALKNDTRPAAVRVLSVLSLSRSKPLHQQNQRVVVVAPSNEIGFSQETVFATSADLLPMSSSTRLAAPSPVSSVMFSTAFGGAASQLIFGTRPAGTIMSFQHNEGKIAQIAFEGHHGNAASIAMPVEKQTRLAKINHSQVAASAAVSGVLFGSKVAFALSLSDEGNKPFALPSLASSALAGAAKATLSVPLQTIRSYQCVASRPLNFSDAVSSIVRSQGIQGLYRGTGNVFSGEMIGAIMYFSTYEAAKSCLAPKTDDDKPVSSLGIGVSGAIAGVVYQTALHEFAHCHRAVNLQSLLGAQQRVLFPSLARAMPIHATLFLCYESAVLAAAAAAQQ